MGWESASDWALCVDFGTSFTGAAVMREGSRPEMVGLGTLGRDRMPSAVFVPSDGGPITVGQGAKNLAGTSLTSFERTPKYWMGQARVRRGGREVPVVQLVSSILEYVYQRACTYQSGTEPVEVRLTHPADWGVKKREMLIEAANLAGIADPVLISEPVAAAMYQASATPNSIGVGEHVAVYDLGGGTFDVAVLERTAEGFEVRSRGGIDPCGGELFDDLIIDEYLARQYQERPEWRALVDPNADDYNSASNAALLRERVVAAKEDLSVEKRIPLHVPGIGPHNITRDDLDELIAPHVSATVEKFAETVSRAGLTPNELSYIFLAGGSSSIPLVASKLAQDLHLERPPINQGDPQNAVAIGGAMLPKPDTDGDTTGADGDTTGAGGDTTGAGGDTTGGVGTKVPQPSTLPTRAPAITAALMVLGALVLAGSMFLHPFGHDDSWWWFGVSYALVVTLLAGVLIALVGAGRWRARGWMSLAEFVIGYFLVGTTLSVHNQNYKGLGVDFWLPIGGAVVVAVTATGRLASSMRSRPASQTEAPGRPSAAATLLTTVGAALLVGSTFLHSLPHLDWWTETTPSYPVVMTVLAAAVVVLALNGSKRRNLRASLGQLAAGCFLVGTTLFLQLAAGPAILLDVLLQKVGFGVSLYGEARFGFWLALAAALMISVGAIAGLVSGWPAWREGVAVGRGVA